MHTQAVSYSLYETAAGFGALVEGEKGIIAHHLPFGSTSPEEARQRVLSLFPQAERESEVTAAGAQLLRRYFAGEPVAFDLPLDLQGFTPFQKRVYLFVFKIPYGAVMSYGAVAEACGCPKGARAVGGAMARNPLPILIPCHRVVGGSGRMTGFTAPGGVDSKLELLRMEGVPCTPCGVSFKGRDRRL